MCIWWVIANRNYAKLKKESQENLASLFSKTSELNKSNSNSYRLLNFLPNDTSLCCLFILYISDLNCFIFSYMSYKSYTLWHISMFKFAFVSHLAIVHAQFPLLHSPLNHSLGSICMVSMTSQSCPVASRAPSVAMPLAQVSPSFGYK